MSDPATSITYDEMIVAIKEAIRRVEEIFRWYGNTLEDANNDLEIEALKATIVVLENLKKLEK